MLLHTIEKGNFCAVGRFTILILHPRQQHVDQRDLKSTDWQGGEEGSHLRLRHRQQKIDRRSIPASPLMDWDSCGRLSKEMSWIRCMARGFPPLRVIP